MKDLGARRVMVVTDPILASSETLAIAMESLKKEDIDAALFDRARVEPND